MIWRHPEIHLHRYNHDFVIIQCSKRIHHIIRIITLESCVNYNIITIVTTCSITRRNSNSANRIARLRQAIKPTRAARHILTKQIIKVAIRYSNILQCNTRSIYQGQIIINLIIIYSSVTISICYSLEARHFLAKITILTYIKLHNIRWSHHRIGRITDIAIHFHSILVVNVVLEHTALSKGHIHHYVQHK